MWPITRHAVESKWTVFALVMTLCCKGLIMTDATLGFELPPPLGSTWGEDVANNMIGTTINLNNGKSPALVTNAVINKDGNLVVTVRIMDTKYADWVKQFSKVTPGEFSI
jgi:hypothetical protein